MKKSWVSEVTFCSTKLRLSVKRKSILKNHQKKFLKNIDNEYTKFILLFYKLWVSLKAEILILVIYTWTSFNLAIITPRASTWPSTTSLSLRWSTWWNLKIEHISIYFFLHYKSQILSSYFLRPGQNPPPPSPPPKLRFEPF